MSASEHGGDPLTTNPRLECTACGEYVYATWPRGYAPGFLYLECECRAVLAEDRLSQPEVWDHAF